MDTNNIPQPMEALNNTGPPPFLSKTYEFVDDPNTNEIVSWSLGNNSFIVWDPQAFAINLLPKYFKHSNFSSFVRQLNTYGFKKVDPDKWEFANAGFLRGQKHLLKNIKRRSKTPSNFISSRGSESCVEIGWFGLDAEIERLRRDKHVLMAELVKLKQQQQNTKSYLKAIEERLRVTELKQRQTMSFLAKAIQNPSFVQQIVLLKDRRKEIEVEISKKRRKKIDNFEDSYVKFEPREFGDDNSGLTMSFEGPSMNMDENIVHKNDYDDDYDLEMHLVSEDQKSFDEGFWGELINKGIEDEIGVDVFVEELGFLDSSPM